jgi:hypothetical protein
VSATWQWAKANPDAAARRIRDLERENAAMRAELKRQRGLWQATYALGLAERDFAIKCIETALGPNKTQSWGDDQIMRQCLNEGGTPT